MEIICLEEAALFLLIDKVVEHVKTTHEIQEDKWIDKEEAMRLLKVRTTTLQKLRDEGRIRFSQRNRKNILYDRDSLLAYLEQNVHEPF